MKKDGCGDPGCQIEIGRLLYEQEGKTSPQGLERRELGGRNGTGGVDARIANKDRIVIPVLK